MLLRCCIAALLMVLVGCVAQRLHHTGMSLIEKGRYEEGLNKLEGSVKKDTGDIKRRMSFYATRDGVIEQLRQDAEKAKAAGDVQTAGAIYRRALVIAPHDFRITDGIRALEKRSVHEDLLKQAEAALESGDLDAADDIAQKVLADDAADARAQSVRAQAERARAKRAVVSPQLQSRLTKPVTLEFRDAAVKMVFDVLSRASGLNFILDKEIRSDTRITIYVRNVAVEDAIDLILVQSQLEKKVLSDNTLLVYPNTPQKVREYQDLVIRSFYLVNSDAKETANLLKNILKVKDIQVDDRLNMIFLRDTPDTVRLAEKLIRNQDLAEPEVVLEMEVMEINRTRAVELGMSWPDTFTWLVPDPNKITLDQLPFEQHRSTDRIGINASTVLRMKQDNGVANLLSNPRIRVKNREQARVLVGDRVPIITATVTPGAVNPVTTETISYLDVGLKLDVQPVILLDDDVSIKVMLEVSTLGDSVKTNSGSVAYRVGTRTVATSLRMRDGETQVLMGLIRDEERGSAGGVPGLMSLPLIGRLFSVPKNEKQKTEIVLSITPRIVRNVRRPQPHEMEFWSGTEASMKSGHPVFQSDAASSGQSPRVPSEGRQDVTPTPAAGAGPAQTPIGPDAGAAQAPVGSDAGTAQTPVAPDVGGESAVPQAPETIQPVQFEWSAPEHARVGETFIVSVTANAPSPLLSAAASLKFDPNVLEVVEVAEGDLLKQGDAQPQFDYTTDALGGRIAVSVSREGFGALKGQGRLFNVTFKVKAASEKSQLQITSMSPVGADNTPVPFSISGPLTLSLVP